MQIKTGSMSTQERYFRFISGIMQLVTIIFFVCLELKLPVLLNFFFPLLPFPFQTAAKIKDANFMEFAKAMVLAKRIVFVHLIVQR